MLQLNRVHLVLLLTAGALLACTDNDDVIEPELIDPTLASHILDCEDITEKAAAHLKAVVEFQKLEIAGRKAHVFKQCMRDRGYTENPIWLASSQQIASETSQTTSVSVDEALENLRRLDMQHADSHEGRPVYWVVKP